MFANHNVLGKKINENQSNFTAKFKWRILHPSNCCSEELLSLQCLPHPINPTNKLCYLFWKATLSNAVMLSHNNHNKTLRDPQETE